MRRQYWTLKYRAHPLRMRSTMSGIATPPFRADHVGSLLRPQELKDARVRAARGEMDRGTGARWPTAGNDDIIMRRRIHKMFRVGLLPD